MRAFYDSPEWIAFSPGHPGGEEATRRLVERSGLLLGDKVLDLCCGGGDSVRLLEDLGFCGFGADRASVVSLAREKHPGLSFYTWEGGALPFEDGVFDAVLCECSLSQLEDEGAVLREVSRVLTSAGLFLVSDVYEGAAPKDLEGFRRLRFEDKTEELRAYAARWLWETGKPFPCGGGGMPQYYNAIFQKSGGLTDGF